LTGRSAIFALSLNAMRISVFLPFLILSALYSCKPIPKEQDAIDLNDKALTLLSEGKYDESVAMFREALQNPRITQASKGTIYRNMALVFEEQQIPDSSIHYSTIAAKCFRKNSYEYLVNMGNVDLLTGKTAAAKIKLLRAADMKPDEMIVNNLLGLLYLGEYEEEFMDLEKALKYNKRAYQLSNSRTTAFILGINYYNLEDYESAEIYYEQAYTEKPDNASYAFNNALVKYKLNKKADAELLFNKVLTIDSTYRETIDNFKAGNR